MNSQKLIPLLAFLFLAFFTLNVQAQTGTLFTVNDAGDTNDASAGDGFCADAGGKCTLRAAIEEANSTPWQDAVVFALPVPSTIELTLGRLNLSTNVYIAGPGARRLTVRRSTAAGTPQFGIFGVQPSNVLASNPTTIRGLTISNGHSTTDGGAVYIEYGAVLQLTEVAIVNNSAAGSAGGIFSAGSFIMNRSLVSGNTANGLFAGGIVNLSTPQTSYIFNSTLTNNTGGQGGAIYNSGYLTLVNDTISHNTARDAGSSVAVNQNASVTVFNTIIGMDNTAVSSLSGAFVSLGNNLITDARNSTGFSHGVNNDQVGSGNTINPLLGNLSDNGGQTDTRALLEGSPAIERGNLCVRFRNCPAPVENLFLSADQRGFNRLGGSTVDVGAYESAAGTMNSFGSLGIVSRPRLFGSLIVTTRAENNEKQYRIARSTGGAIINLPGRDVYIIEIKSKRAGLSNFWIFDLDGVLVFPVPNSEPERDGIKFTWEGDGAGK